MRDALAWTATHPVSDAAFRQLVFMANSTLDTDSIDGIPARTYFQGWQGTATFLGYPPLPDEPPADPTTLKTWRAAKRQVERITRELREKGAITCTRSGHKGKTAEHKITLGDPVDNPTHRPTEMSLVSDRNVGLNAA